jgi:pyridoxal phosphate enzyme (YggS family)
MSTHVLKNFINIYDYVKRFSNKVNIVVVSKTFPLEMIAPLVSHGHLHFGENKVLEAINKWSVLLQRNIKIKLHMLGHLQSNKAKDAVSIFSYIHSLDSEKLASILATEERVLNKKIKYFIQVNFDNEKQKSGISLNLIDEFIAYTKNDLKLDVIGLMCIPPLNIDPTSYFKSLNSIGKKNNLSEFSMGMSNDYLNAIDNGSTFIRIGSAIFGERSN